MAQALGSSVYICGSYPGPGVLQNFSTTKQTPIPAVTVLHYHYMVSQDSRTTWPTKMVAFPQAKRRKKNPQNSKSC